MSGIFLAGCIVVAMLNGMADRSRDALVTREESYGREAKSSDDGAS